MCASYEFNLPCWRNTHIPKRVLPLNSWLFYQFQQIDIKCNVKCVHESRNTQTVCLANGKISFVLSSCYVRTLFLLNVNCKCVPIACVIFSICKYCLTLNERTEHPVCHMLRWSRHVLFSFLAINVYVWAHRKAHTYERKKKNRENSIYLK